MLQRFRLSYSLLQYSSSNALLLQPIFSLIYITAADLIITYGDDRHFVTFAAVLRFEEFHQSTAFREGINFTVYCTNTDGLRKGRRLFSRISNTASKPYKYTNLIYLIYTGEPLLLIQTTSALVISPDSKLLLSSIYSYSTDD